MGEILVSANTSDLPPAIAGNGGSDLVVLWNSVAGVDLKGRIIRARTATSGPEFQVNTTADGVHTFPAVAMMAGFTPGFAVVWNVESPLGRNVLLLAAQAV